jgi:hypothetical protein
LAYEMLEVRTEAEQVGVFSLNRAKQNTDIN